MMLEVGVATRRNGFALEVEFSLPGPGVVALFGRSGSGKSTVVDVIAGLVRPEHGRIVLEDDVLLDTERRIDVPPERRRIGYVFQDARLFPHLSVESNLAYAQKRAVGAPFVTFDAVTRLLGLESLLSRRTGQLSGGERQRVAIGRALLTQPQLLLLDEPLAALDEARREEVLPYLESLRDQLAVPMVYVTHDFGEVLRLATHIVLLDEGRVTSQGRLAQMSLDPHLRAIIGPDEVGAILDGVVSGRLAPGDLARVRVGGGELTVPAAGLTAPGSGLAVGTPVRIQLLARDIIVSTQAPRNLSVRNSLQGVVTGIHDDAGDTDLITIDIGGADVIARVTRAATEDLALTIGMPAWALVKTVSLRGHAFAKHPVIRDASR